MTRLSGKGIGFIDVHLPASALIAKADLGTEDERLKARARRLDLSF